MRVTYIAAALIALLLVKAPAAQAFVVEEEQVFPAGVGAQEMQILSTVDLELFAPLVRAFQQTRPNVSVRYTVVSSSELYSALALEGVSYDLAISSAMDLQMKLANDGFASGHRSAVTEALPDWARWRDQLFAFTQEPAVLIASRRGLEGLNVPQTRQELIALMRDYPDRFRGRIGTYDLRVSGLGYLFATQDARQSDAFWRLAEVMGGLATRLYCCTSDMIDDLESGEILLAYNVIGSYASARLDPLGDGAVLPLSDYTNVMLRTALIPRSAENPVLGGAFIDYLLGAEGRALIEVEAGLPPIDGAALAEAQFLRPIRLGPGLLVYLDSIKRRNFLKEWTAALVQP